MRMRSLQIFTRALLVLGLAAPAAAPQTTAIRFARLAWPREACHMPDTDRVGIYRVQWENSTPRSFAVNLLDADESNIEPRPSVQIGAERQVSGQERSPGRSKAGGAALRPCSSPKRTHVRLSKRA